MKNYCYITLLTNDNYFYGIALLVESMKRVKTKYPLHVLLTNSVSDATKNMIEQLGVSYEIVETISVTDDIHEHNMKIEPGVATIWHDCWTKFKIFDLVQYDKIIFLDADLMFLKNVDHLFEKPHMTAALDGEYFGLWQGWPHFNSGFMVIKPSHELFEDILNYARNFPKDKYPNYVVADQEMLNFYYSKWPEQKELHLNKYYNVFAPYVQESHLEDLKRHCAFIHYVGRKPWAFWRKNPNEQYSEYYYTLGRDMIQAVCNKHIDIKKAQEKLKLSVYAICKNEKANVEKWLDSFGEADYVCVTDTGSTDGTWEFLQEAQNKYKNLIIQQKIVKPWRYDKARNLSMEIIPEDTTIYFMADLDEIIKEKGWSQKVKEVWTPLYDRGMYDYNRDVDEKTDVVLRSIKEYRLHTKYWDHWENIVHEALVNKMGIKQFYMETSTPTNITVWHYPDKTKQKNYVELCEEDLKEYPDDYIMRLQLAIEYEIEENWEKAFEHYHWLIKNSNTLQNFEKARCFSGCAKAMTHQKDIVGAFNYFREGRLLMPSFADNYIDAAQLYYNVKDFKTAGLLCEEALKNCDESNWCSVHDVKSYFVYYIAGLSYFYQGDLIKALAYADLAALLNPTQELINLRNEIGNQLRVSWKK